MEEVIYATICHENPTWDSQDDNYFYKKYVFSKLDKKDLEFLQVLLSGDKTKIYPFSFRLVNNAKKLGIIIDALKLATEEIVVKFDRKNSEVIKGEKELFFFW